MQAYCLSRQSVGCLQCANVAWVPQHGCKNGLTMPTHRISCAIPGIGQTAQKPKPVSFLLRHHKLQGMQVHPIGEAHASGGVDAEKDQRHHTLSRQAWHASFRPVCASRKLYTSPEEFVTDCPVFPGACRCIREEGDMPVAEWMQKEAEGTIPSGDYDVTAIVDERKRSGGKTQEFIVKWKASC